MSSSDARPRSLRSTLVRVVLLMRWLGWLWLVVLGVVTVVTGPDGLNTTLVWASVALATLGLLATVGAARRRFLSNPSYVTADGVLTLLLALTGPIAGAGDFISGGYPASWLFLVAYAANMRVATVVGAAASAVFAGLHVIMGLGATRAYGSIQFLIIAVVVGWGFDSLRRQDRLREEAEVERAAAREALGEESTRAARLEERARIATSLHDSVLQTLKLIRASATDSDEVRYLARVQERQLRRTISDYESPFQDSLRSHLLDIAADVEDTYRIEVDQVIQDDAEMDDRLSALVAATRDVVSHAVKHDGARNVDLFSEVKATSARVDIRTRPSTGAGSIASAHVLARLEEAGGSAVSRPAAGHSREVSVEVPR